MPDLIVEHEKELENIKLAAILRISLNDWYLFGVCRAGGVLRRNFKVNTLYGVVQLDREEVRTSRNCGSITFVEIEKTLGFFGLSFGMELPRDVVRRL